MKENESVRFETRPAVTLPTLGRTGSTAHVDGVDGTPYQVAAGIYNDTVTIEELNKTLRQLI